MQEGFKIDLSSDLRDDSGRFIAHCREAAIRSADEAAEAGSRAARYAATRKSGRMSSSIRAKTAYVNETGNSLTATAEFRVGTNHWRTQEYGTPHHPITGNVRFYWEKMDRVWAPGRNEISHPGNRGVHFMRFGYEVAKEELRNAVKRNY